MRGNMQRVGRLRSSGNYRLKWAYLGCCQRMINGSQSQTHLPAHLYPPSRAPEFTVLYSIVAQILCCTSLLFIGWITLPGWKNLSIINATTYNPQPIIHTHPFHVSRVALYKNAKTSGPITPVRWVKLVSTPCNCPCAT